MRYEDTPRHAETIERETAPVTHEIIVRPVGWTHERHKFEFTREDTGERITAKIHQWDGRMNREWGARLYTALVATVDPDDLLVRDMNFIEPLTGPQHMFGWYADDVFQIAWIADEKTAESWREIYGTTPE